MNEVIKFLKDCGTFYLATTDGEQPRVRPFGAVVEMDGKIYICTNNTKDCFKQMIENPKIEICATNQKGDTWIRICGIVSLDSSLDKKEKFLEEYKLPMYKADDGIFELFSLSGTAVISSFTSEPKSYSI